MQWEDVDLEIVEVDVTSLNEEQTFAFNIVMKTLQDYVEHQENFQPLRLIVAGTAGSGKSYLIKCLVKTIKTLFNSNKSVQVLCPTVNSADWWSDCTAFSKYQQIIEERK